MDATEDGVLYVIERRDVTGRWEMYDCEMSEAAVTERYMDQLAESEDWRLRRYVRVDE